MIWWQLFVIGMSAGFYVSSPRIRHAVNAITARILEGVVWLLHKTDKYYVAPEPEMPQATDLPVLLRDKGQVHISDEEFKRWLAKNPEIKVTQKE